MSSPDKILFWLAFNQLPDDIDSRRAVLNALVARLDPESAEYRQASDLLTGLDQHIALLRELTLGSTNTGKAPPMSTRGRGVVTPVERAMTQMVAHMGHRLGEVTSRRPQIDVEKVDEEEIHHEVIRIATRKEEVRSQARTMLQICRSLPPVHRRQLWSDFRAGWQVARGGAR